MGSLMRLIRGLALIAAVVCVTIAIKTSPAEAQAPPASQTVAGDPCAVLDTPVVFTAREELPLRSVMAAAWEALSTEQADACLNQGACPSNRVLTRLPSVESTRGMTMRQLATRDPHMFREETMASRVVAVADVLCHPANAGAFIAHRTEHIEEIVTPDAGVSDDVETTVDASTGAITRIRRVRHDLAIDCQAMRRNPQAINRWFPRQESRGDLYIGLRHGAQITLPRGEILRPNEAVCRAVRALQDQNAGREALRRARLQLTEVGYDLEVKRETRDAAMAALIAVTGRLLFPSPRGGGGGIPVYHEMTTGTGATEVNSEFIRAARQLGRAYLAVLALLGLRSLAALVILLYRWVAKRFLGRSEPKTSWSKLELEAAIAQAVTVREDELTREHGEYVATLKHDFAERAEDRERQFAQTTQRAVEEAAFVQAEACAQAATEARQAAEEEHANSTQIFRKRGERVEALERECEQLRRAESDSILAGVVREQTSQLKGKQAEIVVLSTRVRDLEKAVESGRAQVSRTQERHRAVLNGKIVQLRFAQSELENANGLLKAAGAQRERDLAKIVELNGQLRQRDQAFGRLREELIQAKSANDNAVKAWERETLNRERAEACLAEVRQQLDVLQTRPSFVGSDELTGQLKVLELHARDVQVARDETERQAREMLARQEKALNGYREREAGLQEGLRQANERVAVLSQTLSSRDRELAHATAEAVRANGLCRQVADMTSEREGLVARVAELEGELEEARQQVVELERSISEVRQASAEVQVTLEHEISSLLERGDAPEPSDEDGEDLPDDGTPLVRVRPWVANR